MLPWMAGLVFSGPELNSTYYFLSIIWENFPEQAWYLSNTYIKILLLY